MKRPPSPRVVIGLGSNVGDRLGILTAAVARIGRDIALVEATSRVYETRPIGPDQPDFLNAAILIRWNDSLDDLLAALLRVEAAFGRVRRERWGPRTLDLDILWSDSLSAKRDGLEVPHPRLNERAFAKLPLLDVAPDAPYRCDETIGVRPSSFSLDGVTFCE